MLLPSHNVRCTSKYFTKRNAEYLEVFFFRECASTFSIGLPPISTFSLKNAIVYHMKLIQFIQIGNKIYVL